jgi:hypothetical protein
MTIKSYLLSVPERLFRSTVGLGAGVAREVSEVALPDGVRNSQLYRNLVDATLHFLIEQVGGVEGVYRADDALPDNFLARRTAGNAVEVRESIDHLTGAAKDPRLLEVTLGLFAVSAVLLALFIRQEGRAQEPVLPMWLFRNKVIVAASISGPPTSNSSVVRLSVSSGAGREAR